MTNGGGSQAPWADAYSVESLPAWRWSTVSLDADNGGLNDAVLRAPTWLVGNLFLQLAHVMWVILLGIMRLGLSGGDILARASYPIDWGFAWVSENILAVSMLILAIALLRIGKMLFALEWITMLRTIIVFTALFASLSYVSGKSYDALVEYPSGSIEDQQGRLNAVGTMPWAADRLTSMASTILAPLSNRVVGATSDGVIGSQRDVAANEESVPEKGVSNVGDPATPNQANPFGTEGPAPTCAAYIDAIQNTYSQSPNANNTLVIVNNLWLNSFYTNWTAVQYGAPMSGEDNLPERSMCHYAEIINETPSVEQAAILRAAYPGINISDNSQVIAMPPGDASNQRRQITAWVACSWNGSQWETNPEFDGVWGQRLSDNDGQGAFNGARSCQNMFTLDKKESPWYEGWELGVTVNIGGFDVSSPTVGSIAPQDDPYLIWGDRIVQALGSPTAGGVEATEAMEGFDRTQLRAINAWASGATGLNYGDRILYPIVTAVVAALFLFSFGAMAIGLLFAQLLMIVCLMFAVPAATVMYALGMPKATQLLKLTVSATFSQVLFTAFLSLLILITGLFQAVLTALPLPGLMGTFVYGLAPLAGFYIMRSMLKRLGMGDMLTASGALSFATTATLRATGDRQLAAMATAPPGGKSGVQNGLSKIPFFGKKIDKFDSTAAPTWENWGPRVSQTAEARRKRDQKRKQRESGSTEKQQNARARNAFLQEQIKNREHLPAFLRFRNIIDKASLQDHRGRQRKIGAALDVLEDKSKTAAVNAGAWTLYGALPFVSKERRESWRDSVRKTTRSADWQANAKNPYDDPDSADDIVTLLAQSHLGGADAGGILERAGHSFIRGLDQDSAEGKLTDAVSAVLSGATLAALGADAPTILTPGQEDMIAKQYAEMTGYAPHMITVTPTGLVGPVGMTPEQLRDAPIEWLRDFEHHLPLEERLMQPDETPAAYRARMEIIGRARGAIAADGRRVDILEANGIDVNDPGVQAEYVRFQQGDPNTRFSRIELLQVSNSETRAIEIAQQIIQEASTKQTSTLVAAMEANAQVLASSVDGLTGTISSIEGVAKTLHGTFDQVAKAQRELQTAQLLGDERAERKANLLLNGLQRDQKEWLESLEHSLVKSLAQAFDSKGAALLASGVSRDEGFALMEKEAETLTQIKDMFDDIATKSTDGSISADQLQEAVAGLLEAVRATAANAEEAKVQGQAALEKLLAEARHPMSNLRNSTPRKQPNTPSWREHSDPRLESESAWGYDVPIFR